MEELAQSGEKVDVVFMDPPRTGSSQQFLASLVRLRPQKVVYISCNPETLARDLDFLCGKGYRMKRGVGVDMFPMTRHVETVCLLSNRKPDYHIKLSLDMDEYYDIIEKEEAEKKK